MRYPSRIQWLAVSSMTKGVAKRQRCSQPAAKVWGFVKDPRKWLMWLTPTNFKYPQSTFGYMMIYVYIYIHIYIYIHTYIYICIIYIHIYIYIHMYVHSWVPSWRILEVLKLRAWDYNWLMHMVGSNTFYLRSGRLKPPRNSHSCRDFSARDMIMYDYDNYDMLIGWWLW